MEAAKLEERVPASTSPEKQSPRATEPRAYRREPANLEGFGYLCWLGSLGFAEPMIRR